MTSARSSAALVTIDEEFFPTWKDRTVSRRTPRWPTSSTTPTCGRPYSAVDEANKQVSQAESIRKFTSCRRTSPRRVVRSTPSLKLKRNVVSKNYADAIERLVREVIRGR